MKTSLGAKTIAAPLPAWVIAAYAPDGRPNAMTASWTGVCNSVPPCVYFSVRESRYTWDCVRANPAFSVNVPGVEQAAVTDYLGIESGRNVDKLSKAGLTAAECSTVHAPYIAEFPLVLECSVTKTIELGSHIMVIGEVRDVLCDEAILDENGKLDVVKLKPFTYCPGDGRYHGPGDVIGAGYDLGRDIAK